MILNDQLKQVNFIKMNNLHGHVHALNSSAAKQKYSFSKAKRFSPYQPMTDLSYMLSPKDDKRSAIIGYGQRSNLADKYQGKYPHAYDIPSAISKSKGYAFKPARHEVDGPMSHLKQKSSIPGPKYSIPPINDNRGASIKSRKTDNQIAKKQYIPGPGSYDLPSAIDNGKHSVVESKFTKGGSMKIKNTLDSLDIRTPPKTISPGPGQYYVEKDGIGNLKSRIGRNVHTKIGHEKRGSFVNKQSSRVPGPGEYKLYSQFDD